MAVEWEFDVREFPQALQRTDYKDFFRVCVSPAIMQTLGVRKNDPCKLKVAGSPVGTVLIWEMPRGIKTKDIQIPKQLLALYKIDSGGKVSLAKMNSQLPNANSITLYEARCGQSRDAPLILSEHTHWAWLLEYELYRAETISPGMLLEGVSVKGQTRSFRVQSVNCSHDVMPYRFHTDCKVQVMNDETQSDCQDLVISQEGLGGLEAQISKLNNYITDFKNVQPVSLPSLTWTNGIILHGPRGIGKSLLLRKIGEAGWRTVVHIDTTVLDFSATASQKRAAIRNFFANATSAQPSVILIDDLLQLIGNYDSQLSGEAFAVSEELRHQMLRLEGSRTLAVATTCLLSRIDPALMRAHGFSTTVGIPLPDTHSRAFILKAMMGIPKSDEHACIEYIASRTRGFVGADLEILSNVVTKMAETRTKVDANGSNLPVIERIENGDIDIALQEVRPSVIQEAFVEIPETRWSDIGGQEEAKNILDRELCRRYKDNHWQKFFGLKPRKGLLLYGPPGCSKTMIARAAATESGLHFIAVKGAEMLSMYVGEAERKLREFFFLARSASPSVIFLDEIDAIGTSRADSQHPGIQLVTTLLNELDGIVELKDVFVLAATNRPDILDTALTRPGRFDQMLYIGPPDLDARRQILVNCLQKLAVAEELEVAALAEETDGCTGAELVNLCHEAGVAACSESEDRNELVKINHKHFTEAKRGIRRTMTVGVHAFFEAYRAGFVSSCDPGAKGDQSRISLHDSRHGD